MHVVERIHERSNLSAGDCVVVNALADAVNALIEVVKPSEQAWEDAKQTAVEIRTKPVEPLPPVEMAAPVTNADIDRIVNERLAAALERMERRMSSAESVGPLEDVPHDPVARPQPPPVTPQPNDTTNPFTR